MICSCQNSKHVFLCVHVPKNVFSTGYFRSSLHKYQLKVKEPLYTYFHLHSISVGFFDLFLYFLLHLFFLLSLCIFIHFIIIFFFMLRLDWRRPLPVMTAGFVLLAGKCWSKPSVRKSKNGRQSRPQHCIGRATQTMHSTVKKATGQIKMDRLHGLCVKQCIRLRIT